MATKQPNAEARRARTARAAERRSLGADGVSEVFGKKRPQKGDRAFLTDLVHRLHGLAISLDMRDLSALAGEPEFVEAREMTNRIRATLLQWTKGESE